MPAPPVDAGGSFDLGSTNFGRLVTIDSETRTMELCFSRTGVVTARGEGGGDPPDEVQLPALFVVPALVDFQRDMMQCLRLNLNANFGTTSGKRTARQESITSTLEWSAFVPSNPPTTDTKGGSGSVSATRSWP